MLSGPELATAFAEAMRRKKEKGVTQQQVADAFGVRQASVSEWGKTGRIAKKHLNLLVEYFSDVVGAEHWGLHEAIQDALARQRHPEMHPTLSPVEADLLASFRQLPDLEQQELLHDVMARAESINQVVQRELKRLGHDITGFVPATKAAKHLPSAPRAEPRVRHDKTAPALPHPIRRAK